MHAEVVADCTAALDSTGASVDPTFAYKQFSRRSAAYRSLEKFDSALTDSKAALEVALQQDHVTTQRAVAELEKLVKETPLRATRRDAAPAAAPAPAPAPAPRQDAVPSLRPRLAFQDPSFDFGSSSSDDDV